MIKHSPHPRDQRHIRIERFRQQAPLPSRWVTMRGTPYSVWCPGACGTNNSTCVCRQARIRTNLGSMARGPRRSGQVYAAWRNLLAKTRQATSSRCATQSKGTMTGQQGRNGTQVSLNAVLARGKLRIRLPLSVAMALQTAGATLGTPGSPMPPSGAPLSTTRTVTLGIRSGGRKR
jgi:hypothetical protein